MNSELKPLEIILSAVCAALYAVLGYLTYLGLFCPVIGVVRFWPAVIVPAVFAALFGPMVGGVGAAIGIFVSDLVIHGDALLSLTVGVPANFMGGYIFGWLSRVKVGKIKSLIITFSLFSLLSILSLTVGLKKFLPMEVAVIFVASSTISLIVCILLVFSKEKWRSFGLACSIGLLVASLYIGLGVWIYSQIFILPSTIGGGFKLPIYTSLIWFLWTFLTEIPFPLIFGPPIIEACRKALPSLRKNP